MWFLLAWPGHWWNLAGKLCGIIPTTMDQSQAARSSVRCLEPSRPEESFWTERLCPLRSDDLTSVLQIAKIFIGTWKHDVSATCLWWHHESPGAGITVGSSPRGDNMVWKSSSWLLLFSWVGLVFPTSSSSWGERTLETLNLEDSWCRYLPVRTHFFFGIFFFCKYLTYFIYIKWSDLMCFTTLI